jgi:hypothetical protein
VATVCTARRGYGAEEDGNLDLGGTPKSGRTRRTNRVVALESLVLSTSPGGREPPR